MRHSIFIFPLLVLLAVLVFIQMPKKNTMNIIKTLEPLQISPESGSDGSGCYILPAGTFLYYDDSMAEGFDRYFVYFNHQGKIEHEKVQVEEKWKGAFIAPLWLWNIDADELKDMFMRFPLTKEDVASAVRANKITRDDLIDIIRSLPE